MAGQQRWHPRIWAAALAMMMAAVAAQLLLSGMVWGAGDFLIFALMLLVAATALQLAMWRLRTRRQRRVAGLLVAGAFLGLWVELAVGIVGLG